ncbi:MAG: ATP-binding protein [Tepidisphaeraceae bacterium]
MPTLTPGTNKPLDLSFATLRSVSPVHIEYLRNMNVRTSMSISVIRDGQLWGLIACHSREVQPVPYDIRAACDHMGQIVALQLSAKEFLQDHDYRMELNRVQHRLLASMSVQDNFADGLVRDEQELLALAGATGAAVQMEGELRLVGKTPTPAQVRRLIEWLDGSPDRDQVVTERLSEQFADAVHYADTASGLLAISVPRYRSSYVLWFRPEVVQTITWAGNPGKSVQREGDDLRLHPRKSFQAWQQVVRHTSLPWKRVEIEAAAALRESIVGIVLKQAEELARLNADLRRTNKELEAFSYSVSHDLRAPFRHIVGFASLLSKREAKRLDETSQRYIETITEAARYAGSLVDGLLAFSQMGRKGLTFLPTSMRSLVEEVRAEVVAAEGASRPIEWQVAPDLPQVQADISMLRLVLRNLLSNAVKYTRGREPAHIDVSWRQIPEAEQHAAEYEFVIRDNGAGFDMRYIDKLFGVFQRLHRAEEFEGTGVGLANVKRIIERHNGRVWAESELGHGATFHFTLPIDPVAAQRRAASMPRTYRGEELAPDQPRTPKDGPASAARKEH